MIPFYIFYSMFGFQRTGDQAWAFGDQRGRGFMIGATAGRTTLAGEGLQHDDGHSHILASTVPVIRAYDPAFAYELAAVVRDGIERMYTRRRGRLLLRHRLQRELRPAAEARGRRRGHRPRHLPVRGRARHRRSPRAACGSWARARSSSRCSRRATCSRPSSGIAAEVYSATSFQQLRHEALQVERWNRLHPDKEPRVPYVGQVLGPDGGPIVVATDWIRTLPDLVAPLGPGAVHRARHGRLRAQRHAREPAGLVRDRRAAHRGGGARRASRAAAASTRARRREVDPRARRRPRDARPADRR